MKRAFLTLALAAGMAAMGLTDEPATPVAGRTTVYSFFVNVVAEPFRFPLIGFFNLMLGNHAMPQLGFVNHNTGDFSTFQMGFVNTIGGDFQGLQHGFVNTVVGYSTGAQFGFVSTSRGRVAGVQYSFGNIAGGDLSGAQIGFINMSQGAVTGAQFGFLNTSIGDVRGAQVGFISASNGDTTGLQFGFVNTSRGETRGAQLGFVNTTAGSLNGLQFGFVNVVDSIESGIPVGFISIVRNGGFRAVEYAFSEFFPVSVGLKLGVERFHTTLFLAYDVTEERSWRNFAVGFGVGSIIPIAGSFFLNPELTSFNPALDREDETRQLLGFSPLVGFNIGGRFSVTAGPTVTWSHIVSGDTDMRLEPLFSIMNYALNDRHSIVVGARAGLRFRF